MEQGEKPPPPPHLYIITKNLPFTNLALSGASSSDEHGLELKLASIKGKLKRKTNGPGAEVKSIAQHAADLLKEAIKLR